MAEGFKFAVWTFGTGLLKLFVRNETLSQFLRLPFTQQKLLLENVALHNLKPRVGDDSSIKMHSSWHYRWQGIRKYFQLPCDYRTRKARSDWIEDRVSIDAKILLLGDDDYLSVELSRRGFEAVEVADCDDRILRSIQEQTKSDRTKTLCFHGDFRDKSFLNERSPEVICIDPPYNLKWAAVFVDQAIRSAGDRQGVVIMLMMNQRCFPFIDLEEIRQQFRDAGFELRSTVEAFNSYPLHGLSRMFLKLAIRLLTEAKVGRPLVFTSDLLVFERVPIFESQTIRFADQVEDLYAVKSL